MRESICSVIFRKEYRQAQQDDKITSVFLTHFAILICGGPLTVTFVLLDITCRDCLAKGLTILDRPYMAVFGIIFETRAQDKISRFFFFSKFSFTNYDRWDNSNLLLVFIIFITHTHTRDSRKFVF